jgi:heme exporter protein A
MGGQAIFSGESLGCLRGDRLIFRKLDFSLSPGDALILTGPNGSGKSSLLRLMAGLLQPFEGRLLWDGTPADQADEFKHCIAYVGHEDAIKPSLTVAEHLRFHAGLAQLTLVNNAMERISAPLDLEDLLDSQGRFLSAGQRRRLALTRLLVRPMTVVWLLDEPTNGLDAASLDAFRLMIQRHRDSGGAVVASTHVDLGLANSKTLDLAAFQS